MKAAGYRHAQMVVDMWISSAAEDIHISTVLSDVQATCFRAASVTRHRGTDRTRARPVGVRPALQAGLPGPAVVPTVAYQRMSGRGQGANLEARRATDRTLEVTLIESPERDAKMVRGRGTLVCSQGQGSPDLSLWLKSPWPHHLELFACSGASRGDACTPDDSCHLRDM